MQYQICRKRCWGRQALVWSLNKRDACARKDEAIVWESLNSEVTDATGRNVRLGQTSVQGAKGYGTR
jgi:hypothetical protein